MSVGTMAVRHEPASAALVRDALTADLVRHDLVAQVVDDVVLVASELVGNAVVHTRATSEDLDVSWDVEPDAVTIRVGDASCEPPRRRTTSDVESGGRGLTIIAALAAEWGTRRTAQGKQVWARIPLATTA